MIENKPKDLQATEILEINHPTTMKLIEEIDQRQPLREQAVELYYKVRDLFLYNPYHLDLRPISLKSSVILQKKKAWCVEKSIVLATGLRALGIPSKLGYGIVVNHIGTEKLTHYLRRPEIVFHGYVSVFIERKWVKTTPAFDSRVCRMAKVSPLEWEGREDALLQAYSGDKQFIEYLHFYGEFDDVPVDLMNSEMRKYYPHLFEEVVDDKEFSFYHI